VVEEEYGILDAKDAKKIEKIWITAYEASAANLN
jgi:hypothetical protein